MRFFIRNMPDASSSVGSPLRRFRLFRLAERVVIGADTVVVCDLNKIRDTIDLPLSELTAEKLRIVKLETRPEAFFKPSKTFVSENYIGVVGYEPASFKLFDGNGKFLNDIGTQGRGPNEYRNIYWAQIDEGSGRVFILPWQVSERDFPGEPRLDGFGKRPAVRKRGNRKFRLEPRYAGKRGRPDRCGPLPDQGEFRE